MVASTSARRVVEAARAAGLEIEVREFPEGTRTAEDAARAIGVSVGQIVKSLVFMTDGHPVLCLVSGLNRVDGARLAVVTGAPPPVILSDPVFASVTPGVSERRISASRILRRPSAEGRPHGGGVKA